MSKLFRTKKELTLAQLASAWSSELVEHGDDAKQCEQDLIHILWEDILNGWLDNSGPLRDGRHLGLRLITPESRAGFIEGRKLLDPFRADQTWTLHNVLVMKEAALDFAQRHHLPSPSWWADTASIPTEVSNDATVGGAKPNTGAALARGKQPRILKYLSEHFPAGVPEPGLYPRKTLQFEILKNDPSLGSLDEGTLKKAIEKYNASLK
jgi:hypothetical protein